MIRKQIASTLTSSPKCPRSNREGSISCLDRRLQMKQPMQTVYDVTSTPFVIETKLLNATVLPILISERRQAIIVDMTTALTGTSSLEST